MASRINFVNSEKLNYLYEDRNAAGFNSVIEPLTARTDRVGCSNSTTLQDVVSFQQGKDYMPLQFRKRNKFIVKYGVTTADATAVAGEVNIAGTHPAPLNNSNWTVDNIALSKAINTMSIKYGESELKDGTDLRNPFLMEIKTAGFDLEESEHYGIKPLQDSGLGALSGFHSSGTLDRHQLGIFNSNAFDNASPLVFPEESIKSEGGIAWRYMNNNQRVKIESVTFQKVVAGVTSSIAASNIVDGFLDEWVPVTVANTTSTANIVWGTIIGTYTIVVEEYLVGHFLTTPYQKNKRPKIVKIAPFKQILFNFQWDTNYINNGMFKIVQTYANAQLQPSSTAFSANPDFSHYLEVTRDTTINSTDNGIVIETFDLLVPPPDDFMLRMVGWEPTAMPANPIVQTVAEKTLSTTPFKVLDQTSPVIPKYLLVAVDPELYNGLQNTTLTSAGQAVDNVSTFLPASITTFNMSINGTNITENITINDLIKMTQDLQKNKALRDIIAGNKRMTKYTPKQYQLTSSGCPYLLLDLDRLNMTSVKDGRMISNVQYPVPQTIEISFTFTTQAHNFTTAQSLQYYPRVYKFYPFAYSQVAGQQLYRHPIYASYNEAMHAIHNPEQNGAIEFDLDMVGGGWLEDVADFFMKPVKAIGRTLVDGARYVRDASKAIHNATHDFSDYSRDQWGYGKKKRSASRASSRASSRKSSKGRKRGSSAKKRGSSKNRTKGILKRK